MKQVCSQVLSRHGNMIPGGRRQPTGPGLSQGSLRGARRGYLRARVVSRPGPAGLPCWPEWHAPRGCAATCGPRGRGVAGRVCSGDRGERRSALERGDRSRRPAPAASRRRRAERGSAARAAVPIDARKRSIHSGSAASAVCNSSRCGQLRLAPAAGGVGLPASWPGCRGPAGGVAARGPVAALV